MRLLAISDLHLDFSVNREALAALPPHREDWLILAGDVGHSSADLEYALSILCTRFAKVIWTPGNHDLWTLPSSKSGLAGRARYRHLVSICRRFGVLTPEDPYVYWQGQDSTLVLAPLFTLYDYSFRPDHLSRSQALAWAEETGIVCADEYLLHPHPYRTRSDWCAARCRYTEQRLAAVGSANRLILINHYPLRKELACLPRIPPFSLWCGTQRTQDWHIRFPVSVVVFGHLHIRSTQVRDGVRFEEVSLGYPRQWQSKRGMEQYLRQILPGPELLPPGEQK
jgi:3',5'-cyclic AMP phosphodiesterase CpdA